MSEHPLQLPKLIHSNISIVLQFVFSRQQIIGFRESRFKGNWPYLDKFLFQLPEEKANKAIFDLAIYLRSLDDQEKFSKYFNDTKNPQNCGTIHTLDDAMKDLVFREACNKIIHSKNYQWNFLDSKCPKLICFSTKEQCEKFKWIEAHINIIELSVFCSLIKS
jgi:hypothetical protein